MQVRTLTGSSIQAALADARRLLGDEVVLLEARPAQGAEPAQITVLTDALPDSAASAPPPRLAAAPLATPRAVPAEAPAAAAVGLAGYGYGAARRPTPPPAPREEAAGDGAILSAMRRAGGLFGAPPPEEAAAPAPPVPAAAQAQLQLINDRLDALERRLSTAVIGAGYRWAAHPLFAELLEAQMRPSTVAALFEALARQSLAPDTPTETLRWALAQELRRRLERPAPRQGAAPLLLMGPAGAGKTALALRLALHPSFYARRRTGVIALLPESPNSLGADPAELYRRFGLPVQCVGTPAEMSAALDRLAHFDQVLIDTPSLPGRPGAAHAAADRLRRLTDAVMPLEVHLVLDATRAYECVDAPALRRLPLAPTSLALTHLDETPGWGRAAEWLLALELPVRFLATAAGVPDGLEAFSATAFAERLAGLA